MEVTIVGWIVIILSIYWFIKNETFLLYLAIFVSTFTATAAINIEKSVTGIAPFYIASGLWMLKTIINYLKSGNKLTPKIIMDKIKSNKFIMAIFIFIFVIIAGEVLMFVTGKTIIVNEISNNTKISLSFSGSNITQPAYLIFMLIFACFISIKLDSKEKIIKVLKVFIISSVFALVWGIIQFCMFYLGIEYPAYIFNNNIAMAQLHYQMVYGIKRVNSIALEPSTFAINILCILPIFITLWLANKSIVKSNTKSNIILISLILLTLICGILTTSSTAYIGIALIVLFMTIYVLFFSVRGKELRANKIRIFICYLIGGISAILVILLAVKVFNIYWGTLIDTFKDMTINKVNLQSGQERGNAVKVSFQIFAKSPILGAGWVTFRSLDAFTNILANTGILGIASFTYIIFVVLKRVIIARKNDEVMSISLGTAVAIMTISLLISIPDLVFAYYWIILAITYNYCTMSVEEKNIENRN